MAETTATTSSGPPEVTSAVTSGAAVTETLLGATTSATTSTTSATSAAETPEQVATREKAAAETKTRVETFGKAEGKDAKLAAWAALSKDEQKGAWKDVPEEVRKELGLSDPARPTYTDFTLAEGFKPDAEQMKAATELFADSGLSQEAAQKFMDMHIGQMKAASEAGVKAFVELQTKWVSEIKADPEIGGDKLTATLASAGHAIDRLAIPGLREALDLTGAGNNPAIVKAFSRLGQMMAEDKFRPGNGAPPSVPLSPAEAIYGGAPKGSE